MSIGAKLWINAFVFALLSLWMATQTLGPNYHPEWGYDVDGELTWQDHNPWTEAGR